MKFKELRPKIVDLYINLMLPSGELVTEFNTLSEAYDELDVKNIAYRDRLLVYLKKGE